MWSPASQILDIQKEAHFELQFNSVTLLVNVKLLKRKMF